MMTSPPPGGGKENKRSADALGASDAVPPAQRRHCASAPEAYMAARIKESHSLSQIGSYAAARRLLAGLASVAPPPMGDATDNAVTVASHAIAFKGSALYWCASASVEEAAGDWDAAAAFLSRGAAFVTSPTQVQTLNTSVVEFEKRREASSGKAIDGMLLEATELGAAPSDTSSSAPSAPTPAVSLLAKTEGYAAAAPAAVSTVPVLPFHGLSDVVSRARAQISKASATLNQTSFVAAAPASTTASASAPAPTSPASPAVPVMAATATAALDPDTLAMPSPAPRPKSARRSSVAGSARRVSIGAQRVSIGPQRVSAPASPDELHMYLGLADSGDESELESDAGTPYIRRQMSGKTGYGPPTPASSLRHSVTKPNPSTSSSVGGAGRVSAGGTDSRSELLAGLDGSMTMLHAKVAEKLAGATDGAPAPDACAHAPVALATIVSGRELLAKDREPPKEAALDPSADAPLAPAPSPMKGGALRVNKRRSSLTPSGIQGQPERCDAYRNDLVSPSKLQAKPQRVTVSDDFLFSP